MSGHGTGRRLNLTGFEAGTLAEIATLASSVNATVQSTTVRSGSYAAKFAPGNAQCSAIRLGILTNGPTTPTRSFFRGFFRFETLPADDRLIVLFGNGTSPSTTAPAIRLNSTGTLSLVSALSGGTVYGTGSTQIVVDRWYRIEVGADHTNDLMSLRVDGTTEIDWTTVGDLPTASSSGAGIWAAGIIDTTGGACTLYLDDVSTDDYNWCGSGTVLRLNWDTLSSNTGYTANNATFLNCLNKTTVDDSSYVSTPGSGTNNFLLATGSLPNSGPVRGIATRVRTKGVTSNPGFYVREKYGGFTKDQGNLSTSSTSAFNWNATAFWNSTLEQTPVGGCYTPTRVLDGLHGMLHGNGTYGLQCSYYLTEVEFDDANPAPTATRVHIDGFDRAATASFYTMTSANSTPATSTTQKKAGSHSLIVTPGTSICNAAVFSSANLYSTTKEYFVSAWVYLDTVPASAANMDLLGIGTATTTGCWVALAQDGSLQIRDVSGLIGSATSANTIPLQTWTRVEMRVLAGTGAATTDGTVEVRVNGDTVLTATNAKTNTFSSTLPVLGTIRAPAATGFSLYYDQFTVDRSDWIGVNYIYTLVPTGAGATTSANMTVTGASTKWQALTSVDDATSYVSTGTTNPDEETYATTDIAGTGVVMGVHLHRRRNAGLGNSYFGLRSRSGQSVAYNSSGTDAGYTTDIYRPNIHPTEGAWTKAELDAAEIAVRNISTTASKISYLAVVVEIVSQSNALEVGADAFVVATQTLEVSVSSLVATTANLELSSDAVVEAGDGSATKELTASAWVASARELEGDAWLAVALETGATALVATEQSKQATGSSFVVSNQEATLAASAFVANGLDLDGDAIVFAEATRDLATGAFLRQVDELELEADANVVVATDLAASGVVGTTNLKSFNATSVLRAAQTPELTTDALVVGSVTLQASAVLFQTVQKNLAASALLRQSRTAEAVADGFVVNAVQLTGSAVVQRTLSKDLATSSVVKATKTPELTVSAVLVNAIAVTADADVMATLTKSFSATFVVREQKTRELEATSVVIWPRPFEIQADANLFGPTTVDLPVSAAMQGEAFTEMAADTRIVIERPKLVDADGVLTAPDSYRQTEADAFVYAPEVNATAVVREQNESTFLAGDALVVLRGAREVRVDATVLTGVLTQIDLNAGAWVQPPGEVWADCVVANTLSSARFCLAADGSRQTDGERTDGDSFVAPVYATPQRWAAGFDATIDRVALAVDTGSSGNLIVLFRAGEQTRTVTVPEGAWTQTAPGRLGWLAVGFDPVEVSAGDACEIAVGGSGPNVLVTGNGISGGFLGNVLNGFAVTDQTAQPDGRPLVAVTTYVSGETLPPETFTIHTLKTDALYVGINATVSLHPDEDVLVEIEKLAFVAGHVVMAPDGHRHEIRFGPEGGMVVDGSLTMQGDPKDRYAFLSDDAGKGATTLFVDRQTNWLVGDSLIVRTDVGSTVVRLTEVLADRVRIDGFLADDAPNGAMLVNLTRNVRVRGWSAGNRAKFWPRGQVTADHAEFRAVGRGVSFFENYELDDCVIWETTYGTETDTPVLLRSGGAASDLTIAQAKTGILVDGDWELGGETILAAIKDQAVKVRNGSCTAVLHAFDVAEAAVSLNGNGGFRGTVHSDRAMVKVTSGSNGEVRVTGSCAGTLLQLDGGNLGFLGVHDVTTAADWVTVTSGILADGLLRRCATTGALVRADVPVLVRFFDEQGQTEPAATLLPGSLVRTKTAGWTGTGGWERDPVVVRATGSSLKIDNATLDLASVPLRANESLTLRGWARGSLTLSLEEQTLAVSSSVWVPFSLTVVVPDDRVATLVVSGTGWVDGVSR